jgi:carbonic anhydrase
VSQKETFTGEVESLTLTEWASPFHNLNLTQPKILRSLGETTSMKILITTLLILCSYDLSHALEATTPKVSGDQALQWLMNGNKRFTAPKVRRDGQNKSDIQRLSSGQTPHAIVLSCSDSRVPPELVFDQKLGEVFVVRTAGESLGDNAIASIEYALEHLGPQLLVVMGHTSCGAVKAALGTLDGSDAGSPALNALVAGLHPHLKSFKGKKNSESYSAEAWSVADGVAAELLTRSAIIKKHAQSGNLKIVTALYNLSDGVVNFKKEAAKSTAAPQPAKDHASSQSH